MNGGREDSFLRRPTAIGSKDPHALKIPARRAEYSLAENVASPFQAEPRHPSFFCPQFLSVCPQFLSSVPSFFSFRGSFTNGRCGHPPSPQ